MSWLFGMGPQKVETQNVASSPPPPTSTAAAAADVNVDMQKAITALVEENLKKDIDLSRMQKEARQKEFKIQHLKAEKEAMKSDFQRIADKLIKETKRQKEEKETLESNLQRINEKYRRNNIFGQFKTKCTQFGSGVHRYISDHAVMATTVGTVTAFAAGLYIARRGFGGAAKFIDPRLVQPSLIRESSFKNPFQAASQIFRLKEDPLMNVLFSPYLESRFRDILNIIKYTKSNKGLYRNVQFFGPPDTGKTVFARSLAHYSGLDFAVINGNDIASKGKEGAAALHEVFEWAVSSRKAMILFIDEADAFLNHRPTELLPKHRREIFYALLNRTRKRSDKYMVVLSSSCPEYYDWSLHERMDEKVELELPKQPEREKILLHCFEHYILKCPSGTHYRGIRLADNFNCKEKLQQISLETEGLSISELTKLVLDLQVSADATVDGCLTAEMIDRYTAEARRFHRLKMQSRAEKAYYANKFEQENVNVFRLKVKNLVRVYSSRFDAIAIKALNKMNDSFLVFFYAVFIPFSLPVYLLIDLSIN